MRQSYNGISATSANQARLIKSLTKNGKFEKARIEASAFLLGIAPPHYATENAPDTWEKLKDWQYGESFLASFLSNDVTHDYFKARPLNLDVLLITRKIPVFNGGGATVYTSTKANLAYRAWHDYTHLKLNKSFDLVDELAVAKDHLKQAKIRGLSRGARWLLWIDSQGQNEYFKIHNDFVKNQYAFCKACFENGLNKTLQSGVKF